MKTFKKLSLSLLFIFSIPAFAQESDGASYYSSFENREKIISEVIDKIKNETAKGNDAADQTQTAEFYSLTAKLNADDAYFMLLDFYDGLLSYSATFKPASAKKKKIVRILFNGLLCEYEPELTDWLAGRLIDDVSADTCDDDMRAVLVSAFKETAPSKNLIILIAKTGADKYLKNELKKLTVQSNDSVSDTLKWGALIALARSGDNDAAARLIDEFVKTEDASFKISVLMPDLAYAPAPDVILLLKQYLDSDYGFAQNNSPIQMVPPANYAADALARMLSGFPDKKDVFSYDKADIDKCRLWMNSQKEFYYK